MNILVYLFTCLIEWGYFVSHDYGIAIVMITIVVRLLLIPVNIRQRKQMSRQQETAQKAEDIKNKYKKNPQKRDKELALLYQKNARGMGGCLLSLIQLPIMICLYKAIAQAAAIESRTVILPWISSLLVRDPAYVLPAATLIVQMLPQLYPYMKLFSSLKLQKQPGSTVIMLLITNSFFIFMIPSGIGLYYFVSGLFQATEQFVYDWICVQKMKIQYS